MVSLLTLPNELLLKITKNLEGKDLANVRLLHSRFAGLELTRLVQESTLKVRESENNKCGEFMLGIPLGMKCSLISRLTQLKLNLRLSNNNLDAFVEVFSQAERMSSLNIGLEMGGHFVGVDLDLDILPPHLTTLRIQSWSGDLSSVLHSAGNLNRLDKLWLQFGSCRNDCAFLQNLPNLSALALLNIESPRRRWNLFIPAMGNLTTLIIGFDYWCGYEVRLCEEIGKHCHSLTDLRLPCMIVDEGVAKLCANHHEGAGVAKKTFRTSITHLTLRAYPGAASRHAITSASIPHFKNLPNLIQLCFAAYAGPYNLYPDFEREFPYQFVQCSLDTDAFRNF